MKNLTLLITFCMSITNIYAWNIYNTSNSGIPSNNIRGIDFDQQGNAWIATDSGLAKFNGITWQVFNIANSGIISNNVLCIKIDNNNIKWVGTTEGLARYDDSTWLSYTTSNSGLTDNYIRSIQIDKLNKKYFIPGSDFSTQNSTGYILYNDTIWTQYTTLNSSLYSNAIRNIIVDSLNRKWILYGNITKYTIIDTLDNWITNNNPSFGGILSITEGDYNTKWFGLTNYLGLLTDSEWIAIDLPNEITKLGLYSYVWYVKKIKNTSKIWIAVSTYLGPSFLCIYDTQLKMWNVFNSATTPIDYSNINTILQDKFDNIWVIANNGLIKTKCLSNMSWTNTDSTYNCKKDSVKLTYNGNKNPSLWLSDNGFIGKNSSNYFYAQDTGVYKLYFTDNNGCSILGSSKYNVGNNFNAQIISSQEVDCLRNNSFALNIKMSEDTVGGNFTWNLIKGISTHVNPTINFDSSGIYRIILVAKSVGGCIDTAYQTLTVNPNPTAGPMLGQTNAVITSTPYIYTVAQQINHTYNWIVSNGIIVAGQGTNAATVQWLSNGKGYLKVEVSNTFGCADTSSTSVNIGNVGLNELSNINKLFVYPNPSNGTFTVSLNALKSASARMSLLNLLGQEIWAEDVMIISGEQNIPIQANLAPGLYTIRIAGQNDQIQQKVVIK